MKTTILSAALTTALVLPAILGNNNAVASHAVHPDCIDNPNPGQCSQVVEQMQGVIAGYVQAHLDADADAIMSYHLNPGVVVGAWGEFYRGYASYRDDLLTPLLSVSTSAELDMSPMRFQVISPNLVIMHGFPIVTIHSTDGSSVVIPERGIMVWTKNPGDPSAPFALAAVMWESE